MVRLTIARWLAPDIFNRSDRYGYLRNALSEAQRWLGYDFPEVDATIHWAKASEVNHFRKLDAPSVPTVPGKPWIWSISDFREHLRGTAISPNAGSCWEVGEFVGDAPYLDDDGHLPDADTPSASKIPGRPNDDR